MFVTRIAAVAAAAALLIGSTPAHAIIIANGLHLNALTQNAVTQNALTQNAITTNALIPNSLTGNAITTNALTLNSPSLNTQTGDAAVGASMPSLGELNAVVIEAVSLPAADAR